MLDGTPPPYRRRFNDDDGRDDWDAGADAETDAARTRACLLPSEQSLPLTGAEAAEHLLSAIKAGRPELITAGVIRYCPLHTRLASLDTVRWSFGGFTLWRAAYRYAAMGLVAPAAGIPAILAAPLEVGVAVAAGATAVVGAGVLALDRHTRRRGEDEEDSREDQFTSTYGFPRSELLRGAAATNFWDLKERDTLLEIALKAKTGLRYGRAEAEGVERILEQLLTLAPGTAADKAQALEDAMYRSAKAMRLPGDHLRFEPVRRQLAHLRQAAARQAAPAVPTMMAVDELEADCV